MSSSEKSGRQRRFRWTLFARLVIGFVVGGVLMQFWSTTVGGSTPTHRSMHHRFAALQMPPHEISNRVQLTRNLFTRFREQSSARLTKREIARGLKARYTNENQAWESEPGLLGWEEMERTGTPFPPAPEYSVGPNFVAARIGDARAAVFFPEDFATNPFTDFGFRVLVLGQVLILVTVCLLFAFWQFRPLKVLTAAARRMASGDLSTRVAITQNSEIGDLAEAFNEMAERISVLVRSREDLLADISHELRSPLTRARLAIELGGEDAKSRILKNLSEMDSLVGHLLEAHRLHRDPNAILLEPLCLSSLVRTITEAYSSGARKIVLTLKCTDDLVMADRDRIERVVTNLLDNAVKYSSGAIDICVEADRVWLQVTVSDRGPGVPEPMLSRLFEPFFRVDRSRTKSTGGFGLGLDLCQRIITAHKGTISASNRSGGGLQVSFRIPREQPISRAI